jgi:hypothetical protein
MKQLALLPLMLVCLLSKGQDSSVQKKQPQTELEKAQIKIGAIIKKEYFDIYYDKKKLFGGKFTIQVLNITDAASGIVLSGLYVQYTDPGNSSISSQTFSSFIDLDEVPGLLKFIDFLDKTSSENPATYTEYIFNSRDLQLYGYYDPTRLSPWVYGFKLDKFYSSRSTRQVDLEVLDQIKKSINNAKDNFKKPLPEVKEPGKG